MRPLVIGILAFFMLGLLPAAGAHSDVGLDASMTIDRMEASPGDSVTFLITIELHRQSAHDLVVTDLLPEGLAFVSAEAPTSCSRQESRWVCSRPDLRSFSIEIRTLVEPGTEGTELIYVARIEVVDDDDESEVLTVHAGLLVVPPAAEEAPHLEVQFSVAQSVVVPDTELNYRIEVTNDGSAGATNVSVNVFLPPEMTLLSAFPLPAVGDRELRWTVGSMPIGSLELLFNTTVPSSTGLTEATVEVAVAYGDEGGEVQIKAAPSTLSVVPAAGAPSNPLPGLLFGFIVLAAIGLLVAQRIVPLPLPAALVGGAEEIFLLHRSGVVLNHYASHESREADSDIVGGMMAAVRMFVEDTVSPDAGPLREIRFGRGNILFVPGDNVILAAVNTRGRESRFTIRAMRFVREFERTNREALMNFDGYAQGLEGIEAAFKKLTNVRARREVPVDQDAEVVPRQ